jgi:tetratricopeptide (TPR) repeat protein
MHAPVDSRKLIDYSDTIRAYSDTFRSAQVLDKGGKYKEAIEKYETAYNYYTKAMSLNDYDLGARRLLPKERIAPAQLADSYSKCLAKQGLHKQVVMFYERFFSDFGEGHTGVEVALKKRADKSRLKALL